ncbi:MAG: hypothetical protein WBA12_00230 [Catalinimonas sp.]
MKKIVWLLLPLLAACGRGLPSDQGDFDQEAWRSDKLGCEGVRAGLADSFGKIRDELSGMTEPEIRGWLGTPDRQELQPRGQKFYVYFLQPGGQCSNTEGPDGELVRIRFSALNRVVEVSYDNLGTSASGSP